MKPMKRPSISHDLSNNHELEQLESQLQFFETELSNLKVKPRAIETVRSMQANVIYEVIGEGRGNGATTEAWIRDQYRDTCEKMLLSGYPLTKPIDTKLWKIVFYQKIESLRMSLKQKDLGSSQKYQVILELSRHLDQATGFYYLLINTLKAKHGFSLDATSGWRLHMNFFSPEEASAIQTIHKGFMYLGDLERYRQNYVYAHGSTTYKPCWEMTASYYETAVQVYPPSDKPCNQLAYLRSIQKKSIESVYWHLRGISCTDANASLQEKFSSFLKELVDRENSSEFILFLKEIVDSSQSLNIPVLFSRFTDLRAQVTSFPAPTRVLFILLTAITELMQPAESDLLSLPVRSLLALSLAIHLSLNDQDSLNLLTAWICSQKDKVRAITMKAKSGEIRHLLPECEPLTEAYQKLTSTVSTLLEKEKTQTKCWTLSDLDFTAVRSFQSYYCILPAKLDQNDSFRWKLTTEFLQPFLPLCVSTPTLLALPNLTLRATLVAPDCLVSHWHIIKSWIEKKKYLVLVPLFALEALDEMKKTSGAAREVIRQMEAYVTKEHAYLQLIPTQVIPSLRVAEQLHLVFPKVFQLYHGVFIVTASQDVILECRELGMDCEWVTAKHI